MAAHGAIPAWTKRSARTSPRISFSCRVVASLAIATILLGADATPDISADATASRPSNPSPNISPPPKTVILASPLNTIIPCPLPTIGAQDLSVTVTVPADAPADLGIGAWAGDLHGHWFQCTEPGTLTPGTHRLTFHLAGTHAVRAEGARGDFDPAAAIDIKRSGLFLWSASFSVSRLVVADWQSNQIPDETATSTPSLEALRIDGLRNGVITAKTGERWTCSVIPDPFPADPYDRAAFALDALITATDGTVTRIPGFYTQPMRGSDRGDEEVVTPDGEARFALRWRAQKPGNYRIELLGHWGGDPYAVAPAGGSATAAASASSAATAAADPGTTATAPAHTIATILPPFHATGPAWDDYVRVDKTDPRFLAVDGAWFWPTGPNLRSIWDLRCAERLDTVITPDRGTASWRAYFERLGENHVNQVEIWLSSWSLGLEWRADWPGYHGIGRYNEAHAWQLDRVLDAAQRAGVRVLLVIANHGIASEAVDSEWPDNPWNRALGGPLADAADYFTDPRALAGQERLRTYLVARYADHPAILGWKLWSEVNLTAAHDDPGVITTWHRDAAARWHALDTYGHPVTSHWAGDWHAVQRDVAALPGLDLVTCDAYHGPGQDGALTLADLMITTTGSADARHGGLAQYGKPVLVSEYGGNWDACPPAQMEAEHASGAWLAMVSGQGAGPMLWWFEWVDQGARFAPYRAIAAYLAGEDLRGADARSVALTVTGSAQPLWAHAWSRPGHLLGYVLDPAWAASGTAEKRDGAQIPIGSQVAAGHLRIEWWNADDGTRISRDTIDHPGGPLVLSVPGFLRHCAFKLIRVAENPGL